MLGPLPATGKVPSSEIGQFGDLPDSWDGELGSYRGLEDLRPLSHRMLAP